MLSLASRPFSWTGNRRVPQLAQFCSQLSVGQESKKIYYQKNKETIQEYKKIYYQNNKETIQEHKRIHYQKNKEAIQERQKIYRQKNKVALQEQKKIYCQKNKEAVRERQKIYRQKNKETLQKRKKIYYQKNKNAVLEHNQIYYQKNKETLQEHNKLYYQKNKDALQESMKIYYQKNRTSTKIYSRNKSWDTPEDVRRNLDRIAEMLVIEQHTDWYRVSSPQIHEVGGGSIFSTFGSLYNALTVGYPEIEWDAAACSTRGKRAAQRWLFVQTRKLLPPDTQIYEDCQHPELSWPSHLKIEFDIWIPSLKLALEYQGEQHYHDNYGAYGPQGEAAEYQRRDEEKLLLSQQAGITLVPIPYWWDGNTESLQATLHLYRPELFSDSGSAPIPNDPPEEKAGKQSNSWKTSFLMHGVDWKSRDPTNWIMSEKLDGIRAVWTGEQLLTRQGKVIHAPDSFLSTLPRDIVLDGELWCGYNSLTQLFSILMRTAKNPDPKLWDSVSYKIFDAPEHDASYPKRHAYAQSIISQCDPHITMIPIQVCSGVDHLQSTLMSITKIGSEGLMIYHPTSKYKAGRVENMQKVKLWEEVDVKFLQTRSKSYTYLCEQQDGVQCVVKVSGYDYRKPPPVGTVLPIRYSGIHLKSGKLKNGILENAGRSWMKKKNAQGRKPEQPRIEVTQERENYPNQDDDMF